MWPYVKCMISQEITKFGYGLSYVSLTSPESERSVGNIGVR